MPRPSAFSAFIAEHRLTDLVTWAVPPGMRPEQMSASLKRFATEATHRLKARICPYVTRSLDPYVAG